MRKDYLLLASTALMFAACANDEFTGNGGQSSKDNAPIAFNMQTGAQTRATSSTGADAAAMLNNEFIVWGEKNESAGSQASDGNLVFKNYKVDYTASSAGTTLSNTKDWEYVGLAPYQSSVVSPSIYSDENTKQTIKYWDFSASSYTFTAVSALKDNLTSSKVKITKTESGTSATDKGYSIELKDGASASNIYVSDRLHIEKPTDGAISTTEANKYGSYAQLTFRNFSSKIRFGVYETVPGYKVVITGIKFGSGEGAATHTSTSTEAGGKTFGINGNFVVAGSTSGESSTTTTYTVKYDTNNKATVTLETGAVTKDTINTWGIEWLSTSKDSSVGTSSTSPTYDKAVTESGAKTSGIYTSILPNPSNAKGLTLQVSYKLISEDTGEEIVFKSGENEVFRTVNVPAAYCQWKSNYAYTYLFKITDASAELYPISFDAVVETDEIGKQETITTVTDPSITTLATSTADGKTTVVTGKDEYETGNTIYAAVRNNASSSTDNDYVTLSVDESNTNIKLYTVTATDGFPITEASVAQALSSTTTGTKKLTVTNVTISAADATPEPSTDPKAQLTTSVPAEDGGMRTISALKWTPTSAATYAVEYIYTPSGSSDAKKVYKIVKVAAAATGGGAKFHD